MGKRAGGYTAAEAEALIPIVAKRLALEAVDLVISLDTHPVDSQAVERRMFSLTGQTGYLRMLCHTVWRGKALEGRAVKKAV